MLHCLDKPSVTVPAFSTTSISFVVPAKVKVPPNATGEVFEPSETVIEELESELLPIFVIVLSGPLIVLFVSVFVLEVVTIVPSTANVTFEPDTVDEIPVPPKIPNVSPFAFIVATVEVSSFTLIFADKFVPSPRLYRFHQSLD